MNPGARYWLMAFVGAALGACLLHPALAQSPKPADPEPLLQREIVVGTKEAPPFAMKSPDGEWSGISIDLWRRIAKEKRISFRFHEEQTVPGLVDAVAQGKVDIAVAALTVTSDREQKMDFTSAFYGTGLGIAVANAGAASLAPVMRTLTSFNFLRSVLALIGLALVVGFVVWLLERRHNEEFGGGVAKGLSSSVWWTTVAMTQRGIGQQGPRTVPGRFVAMLWMVGSIIAIAVFTGGHHLGADGAAFAGNGSGRDRSVEGAGRRGRRLLDRGHPEEIADCVRWFSHRQGRAAGDP